MIKNTVYSVNVFVNFVLLNEFNILSIRNLVIKFFYVYNFVEMWY